MSEVRLYFKNAAIRDDGEFLCLTDMWRAAGDDSRKRPSDWLAFESTAQFREYLETTLPEGSLSRATEGRSGATWAHWQLGMAYAKYLSPAFHAWCNDVVRKVMAGVAVSANSPDIAALRDELCSLTNNVAALWGHISQGGYIARARFEALRVEWQELADLEAGVGRWPSRRAAIADIQRDMREATGWGGKGKPWAELPAALEPATRAVIKRRRSEAMKRLPPSGGSKQLSLLKSG